MYIYHIILYCWIKENQKKPKLKEKNNKVCKIKVKLYLKKCCPRPYHNKKESWNIDQPKNIEDKSLRRASLHIFSITNILYIYL